MLGGLLWFIGGFMFSSVTPPVMRELSYLSNSLWSNAELSPEQLAEARFRQILTEDEYFELMKKHGYSKEKAESFFEVRKRLLTAEELLVAKWRGFISEEEYRERMRQLGFRDEDIEKYEAVRKYYPSPTDFIRFAVRDVFNPQVVEQFGYDEAFPEDIVPFAKKSGMEEDVLRWYWRAHWELPSPTAGYEMLHRLHPEILKIRGEAYKEMGLNPEELETDLETVDLLLKTADYPSFWRKRLLAISYAPLTRVDLRRIYELGLISDDELLARLMELGYSKKDAELMLEFYKAYKHSANRDLTVSMTLKAYLRGLMTREDCKSYLQYLGYDEDEAELIISLEEEKMKEERLDDAIDSAVYRFSRGLIDEERLRLILTDLGLPEAEKELIVEKAYLEREKREKLPTKADLISWLKQKVITKEDFKQWMKRLGYKDDVIELYLKAVTRGG